MDHQNRQMGHISSPNMEPFSIRKLDEHCHHMNCPTATMRSIVNCFIYLTAGEVLVESEDKNVILQKDEFLLIPQGVPFSIRYYKDSFGYMGGFHNSFLGGDIFNPAVTKNIRLLQSKEIIKTGFPIKKNILINEMLDRIFEETQNEISSNELIKCLLMSIIVEINADINLEKSELIENASNKFLDLIFDDNQPLLTVAEYAEKFNITPNHLNKTVKKNTGKAVSCWIEESVIMRSKILLKETNLSIAEIAEKLNILDQSYFSRKFKKHEKTSPLSYRKRNKKS